MDFLHFSVIKIKICKTLSEVLWIILVVSSIQIRLSAPIYLSHVKNFVIAEGSLVNSKVLLT